MQIATLARPAPLESNQKQTKKNRPLRFRTIRIIRLPHSGATTNVEAFNDGN